MATRHYATERSPELAERMFDAAISALEPIKRMPGMGPHRLEPLCEFPGLRSWRVTDFPVQWLLSRRMTPRCRQATRRPAGHHRHPDCRRVTQHMPGTPVSIPATTTRMSKVLFDFTNPDAANAWHAIDDRVMGGISHSTLRQDPAGHAVFEGIVSLEHNGGFASVRSDPGERGLTGAESCVIELRGDKKQFKLSLLTDDGFDSLNYQASFAPAGDDWHSLHLPLADFRATFRGREVADAPPLDPARIRQVGPFVLDVRRISLG